MMVDFILLALYVLGIVCFLIHFRKYCRSSLTQKLVTKNLTVYCFTLLAKYVLSIFIVSFQLLQESYSDSRIYQVLVRANIYPILLTEFFKFVMIVEIFVYFYKMPNLKRPPFYSDFQTVEFFIYCILGTVLPFIYFLTLFFVYKSLETLPLVLKIIRTANLFPILDTIWRLVSSGMGKTELFDKYSVRIRFITIIATYSVTLNIVQFVYWVFITLVYPGSEGVHEWAQVMHNFESIVAASEGVVIGVLFTFMADTFQPIGFEKLVTTKPTP